MRTDSDGVACNQRVTTSRPFGASARQPSAMDIAGQGVGLAQAEGSGGDALEGLAQGPDDQVVTGGGPQCRADAVTQNTECCCRSGPSASPADRQAPRSAASGWTRSIRSMPDRSRTAASNEPMGSSSRAEAAGRRSTGVRVSGTWSRASVNGTSSAAAFPPSTVKPSRGRGTDPVKFKLRPVAVRNPASSRMSTRELAESSVSRRRASGRWRAWASCEWTETRVVRPG